VRLAHSRSEQNATELRPSERPTKHSKRQNKAQGKKTQERAKKAAKTQKTKKTQKMIKTFAHSKKTRFYAYPSKHGRFWANPLDLSKFSLQIMFVSA
jgi:hypothetical protein